MVWDNRGLMSLKLEFISRAEKAHQSISFLCKEYKISRKTGYKWLKRYKKEGVVGLYERSRFPLRQPSKTGQEVREVIVQIRDKHPEWGARKLKQRLLNLGSANLPSESTFNRILKLEGKIDISESLKRKRWIRFEREHPNELWQMDFKGWFLTQEGKCYPLTVLDDHSRYAICLKACTRMDEQAVRGSLEEAFHLYGLPEAMTMDNGTPWKGAPGERFSKLTIWLMRLGIKIGHSRPYHPQTQGKDERFHRTLKAEVLKYHNFATLKAAQERFDDCLILYNEHRPHDALSLMCPVNRYRPSPRIFPQQLPPLEYDERDEVRTVSSRGAIRFKGIDLFLGECWQGEKVAVRACGDNRWDIYYAYSWLKSLTL